MRRSPFPRLLALLLVISTLAGSAAGEVTYVDVPGFYAVIRKIDARGGSVVVKTHPEGRSLKFVVTPKTLFYKTRYVKGQREYTATLKAFKVNDFIYVTSDNLKASPVVARAVYESNTLTMMALRLHTTMELYGKVERYLPEKRLVFFRERGGRTDRIIMLDKAECLGNNRKVPLEKLLKEEMAVRIGFEGVEDNRPEVCYGIAFMDRKTCVTRKMRTVVAPNCTEGVVSAVDMKHSVITLKIGGESYRFYFDGESVFALGRKAESPVDLKGRSLMFFYTKTSKPNLYYLCEAIDEKAILDTYEMLVKNKGVLPIRKR